MSVGSAGRDDTVGMHEYRWFNGAKQMATLEEQLAAIEARLSQIEAHIGLTPVNVAAAEKVWPRPAAAQKQSAVPVQNPAQADVLPRAVAAGKRLPQPNTATNVMAWAAGFAFLLATVYFLKLVYDSGWLTPLNQLLIAVMAGLAFIAAGIVFAMRDREYAAYLPAFGMVILYVAIYVGQFVYALLTPQMAMVAVALVSVTGIWLDRRFSQSIYVIFATAAVYLSPLLIHAVTSDVTDLVIYFTAWSLLFSFCAVQENRRLVYVLAMFFAMIGFDVAWRAGSHAGWQAAAIFQLLQFAIFSLTAAYLSVRHREPMQADVAIVHGLALAYFYATEYLLLHRYVPDMAPWLAMASAAFLLLVFLAARAWLPEDRKPAASAVLVSAYCALVTTHAVFIELLPHAWLPWAALMLSALVVQIALRFAQHLRVLMPVMVMAALLFVWGLVMLLTEHSALDVPQARPALALYALLLYAAYFRLSRHFAGAAHASLLLYAAHLAFMVLTVRVLDDRIAVSLVWALFAIALLFVAIRYKDRTLGSSSLLIFTGSGLKVLLYDLSHAGSSVRIITLVILGGSLYLGGWLYQQLGKSSVRLHPNAEVNRQLNLVRDWLAQGLSVDDVVMQMEVQGIRNLDKQPWTREQLQSIIGRYQLDKL